MPYQNTYVLFTLIAALIAAFCAALYARKFAHHEPIQSGTASVRLIKKKRSLEYTPLGNHCHTAFWLMFLTDTEELIEIRANHELDFDYYHVGDCGVLTYVGSRMIKFERTHINLHGE